jgi:type I restriction enzyme S subunit
MKINQFTEINYIDISSVKEGKINNIQLLTDNYPSRAKRIIKKNDILYSTVRPNLKGYTFITENIKNGIATTGFAVIRTKKINPMYIYSLLIDEKITEYLINNSSGSSYPAVNSNIFKKIKIKLPKNKELITNLEPLFNKIETLQNEIKENNILYQQYIKELSKDAIPTNNIEEIKEIKVKELSKDAIPTNNVEKIINKSKKNIII